MAHHIDIDNEPVGMYKLVDRSRTMPEIYRIKIRTPPVAPLL